jgi:hypothetical protein
MTILPYKLATTNDELTSRAGLLAIAQVMQTLKLTERLDQAFPLPQSNRGFKPSQFIQTLILMQHEGSFHLDEVRHLEEESALVKILGIETLPKAGSIGAWLKRMGKQSGIQSAWETVNKAILKSARHHCQGITLDIDATEIIANKADAKWTYKKNKGYMPMVGHIAETGQVVACDFREGNGSPAKENLEFIKQCEAALPDPCFVKKLRIDAAGYQVSIIQYCDEKQVEYAIRAKMSAAIKEQIESLTPADWSPLLNKQGDPIDNQDTYRMPHWIGDYDKSFTLVIQRKAIKGQTELELEAQTGEEITANGFIYRAIATNRETLNDSEVVHWYHQRAEDSENRIKELKLDFGGDTLPCSDFKANNLYFLISALSYNLFALMRQLLPVELSHHRVTTIRWRVYAVAAKIVKTGRQLWIKLKSKHQWLLESVLEALRRFDPPPI